MRVMMNEEWTPPSRVTNVASLDWEALGRLVRRRTLEAVSRHFAACATAQEVENPDTPADHSVSESRA